MVKWNLMAAIGTPGAQGPAGPDPAWKGTWSAVTGYVLNDLVEYNGSTYICTNNNTNSAPSSALGVSWIIWRGVYDGATAYAINDVVYYNGSSFICTVAGTGTAPTPASVGTAYSKACGGRLTLTSGTPATTSDVTGAGTLYFTPYLSNELGLYVSSIWSLYLFSEVSLSLSGLTTTQPYDIFIFDNSGTVTMEAVAWSSPTARATGLVYQDGVIVKVGSLNKRYIGTINMQATSQCEDSILRRFVWNMYNRLKRRLAYVDSSQNSYTYGTATWRQQDGLASNKVEAVVGRPEAFADLIFHITSLHASGTTRFSGIGFDTITGTTSVQYACSSTTQLAHDPVLRHYPGQGYHYWAGVEFSNGAGSTFFAAGESGINGWIEG